jgi:hypothetical protein
MFRYLRGILPSAAMALAVAFLATGCASLNSSGSPSVGDVQSLAVKACSFLPIAETVKTIIDVKSPALNTSAAIASAICEAISPKAGPGAGKASVAGVPIQGLRVR